MRWQIDLKVVKCVQLEGKSISKKPLADRSTGNASLILHFQDHLLVSSQCHVNVNIVYPRKMGRL